VGTSGVTALRVARVRLTAQTFDIGGFQRSQFLSTLSFPGPEKEKRRIVTGTTDSHEMPKRAETTWPAVRGQLSAQSTPIRSAPPLAGPAPERGYGQQPRPAPASQNRTWFHDQARPLPGPGSAPDGLARRARQNPPPREFGALTRRPRPPNAPHPGRHRMSPRPQATTSPQVKASAIVKAAARSGSGDELSFGKRPQT
jgi:hypothetical protein